MMVQLFQLIQMSAHTEKHKLSRRYPKSFETS